MRKKTWILMLALTLISVSACSSDAGGDSQTDDGDDSNGETLKIDLATVYNAESPDVAGAEKFADIVNEKTGGKIEVNIFPNGTLGSERDNFTEVSNGDLEMVLGGSAGIEMFAPEYMFFLAPFLIKDIDQLNAWFESDLHADMVEEMKENNVRFLGDIVRGARNTTANKPIQTPEDLEGLKLRLPETPTLVSVFSELGAQPTTVALPELYSSLQTGVVEGSEGPYEQIATNRLDEVQDYLTNTQHIFDVTELWISQNFYESMTEEQQKVIDEAGAEAAQYASDLAAEKQDEFLNQLVENGMEIIDLTDEQVNAFNKKAEPALRKLFEEQFTVTTYEEFMGLIE